MCLTMVLHSFAYHFRNIVFINPNTIRIIIIECLRSGWNVFIFILGCFFSSTNCHIIPYAYASLRIKFTIENALKLETISLKVIFIDVICVTLNWMWVSTHSDSYIVCLVFQSVRQIGAFIVPMFLFNSHLDWTSVSLRSKQSNSCIVTTATNWEAFSPKKINCCRQCAIVRLQSKLQLHIIIYRHWALCVRRVRKCFRTLCWRVISLLHQLFMSGESIKCVSSKAKTKQNIKYRKKNMAWLWIATSIAAISIHRNNDIRMKTFTK